MTSQEAREDLAYLADMIAQYIHAGNDLAQLTGETDVEDLLRLADILAKNGNVVAARKIRNKIPQ